MTGKTRYDLDRSAHAVFSLYYHIIFESEGVRTMEAPSFRAGSFIHFPELLQGR